MNHYRQTIKRKHSLVTDACPFCSAKTVAEAVVKNDLVYVVPNLTRYDLWESHDVEDHLLIVPKRHVETLDELTAEERLAVMDQAAVYEKLGYSVYARGVGFVRRTIKHQHTHLIKTSNKAPKIALFLGKPYYLFKR